MNIVVFFFIALTVIKASSKFSHFANSDSEEGFKDSDASGSEDSDIEAFDFTRDERLLNYIFKHIPNLAVFEAQLDIPIVQQALERVSLKVAHLKVLRAQQNIHRLHQQISKHKSFIKSTKSKLRKQNALPDKRKN